MVPIRILIAESNSVIAHALQRLLQPAPEIAIVAIASEGGETLQLAARYQPAVAVLNVGLPSLNGRAVIPSLRERFPSLPIVALAIYPALREVTLAAGACRFALLDGPPAELIAAIQYAAAGECQSADASELEES